MYIDDYPDISNKHLFPRDYFGWIFLIFVIGSITLTGYGQLKLIGILLAGGYTSYFLIKKLWIPKEIIIFFVWMLWAGATGYIVSIDKEAFLKTFMVVFQIGVMSFAISGITANRRNLNTLFIGLLIGGIILFLYSFFSGELFKGMEAEAQVQVSGLTRNPNDYGYNLLVCASALLFFWANSISRKKKILIIFLFVVFSIGIIFSASRKSFLGLVMLVLLWQFICFRKEILKRPYLIIFFMVVVGSLYFVTNYMLSNTYMGTRVEKEIEKGLGENTRVTLYKEGIEYIRGNPIFGIGLGNFAVRSSLRKESHSDYIEVIASTGIIGALMYFSIYLLLWKRLNRLQKNIENDALLHDIGLFKAIIIIILLTAIGRPNFTDQITFAVLSSIIGYTWALEKRILYLKKLVKYK